MNAPVMVELEGETDPLEVKLYFLFSVYFKLELFRLTLAFFLFFILTKNSLFRVHPCFLK
jgi:hypothetical protein